MVDSAWVTASVQISDDHTVQKKMFMTFWTKRQRAVVYLLKSLARLHLHLSFDSGKARFNSPSRIYRDTGIHKALQMHATQIMIFQ